MGLYIASRPAGQTDSAIACFIQNRSVTVATASLFVQSLSDHWQMQNETPLMTFWVYVIFPVSHHKRRQLMRIENSRLV